MFPSFSFFIKQYKKYILLNHKGFSLLELIISAGALGFFAILVQSMLVLGHSFTKSQQNLFESFSTVRMVKQNICMINSSFNNVNILNEQSYSREEEICGGGPCQQVPDPNNPGNTMPLIIHSRKYKRLPDSALAPNNPKPLMGIHIDGLSNADVSNAGLSVSSNIQLEGGNPLYYKVFQDSHTVVRLNINMTSGGVVSELLSGYIFASRCIENDPGSIKGKTTFNADSTKKRQAAMHILEKLTYRPFYFPSSEKGTTDVIKCCTEATAEDEEPKDCKPINEWIPRIYVIHLSPVTPTPPKEPDDGFAVTVEHIQEFPELQDLNSFWSIGFVLSMDNKTVLSQSAFQLDTLILKNTCSTSATSIQKCPNLTLGTDLKTTKLMGMEKTMDNFIIPDISSCSGYSSGVDTTGVIKL